MFARGWGKNSGSPRALHDLHYSKIKGERRKGTLKKTAPRETRGSPLFLLPGSTEEAMNNCTGFLSLEKFGTIGEKKGKNERGCIHGCMNRSRESIFLR